MKTRQLLWTKARGWSGISPADVGAQLVLFFGGRDWIAHSGAIEALRHGFPRAHVIGCSTGGQIVEDAVRDDEAAALAFTFERTGIRVAREPVKGRELSFDDGQRIARALHAADLSAIFVLSDGLNVNGSQLVAGIRSAVASTVVISGGLAGDGANFENTVVHLDGVTTSDGIVAIGFYGDAIRVGHGSAGGWSEFGPKRRITRSDGNVLFAVDGKPALDLYKSYLGEEAAGLPGTGLLYPLLISDPDQAGRSLVRTILSVDHEAASLTFAGDMPEGWTAQLMRGQFQRLANAAAEAARAALPPDSGAQSEMAAVLISCIGRRILMGESIISEIAAAREALGRTTSMLGFYSYGEIAPQAATGLCEFHNQTMTVTTFTERL